MQLKRIQTAGGAPFTVNAAYADRFTSLLNDLEASGYGIDPKQSGGYANRNIAGRNKLSNHAHGAAVDVNWNMNGRGGMGNIPAVVARDLAKKHGMTWGGDWKNPDPMHFEIAGGHSVNDGHDHGTMSKPSMMAPASQQQPTAMGLGMPQQQQPQQEDRGLFGNIAERMQNPLFQQGLGLFLAASQGKDLNQGLQAGSERANSMLQNQAMQREMVSKQARDKMWAEMFGGGAAPDWAAGMSPATMQMAKMLGPDKGAELIARQGMGGQTDDIKEFEYAKKSGFQGTLQDWMVSKRANSGEYNKNLVYGTDANGNVIPMQAGTRGDLVASKMPEGVSLQRDPIKMDGGDRYILLDPTTRQPIGEIKKNLAEAERQKEVGTAQGKAQVSLPAVESSSKNVEGYIDKVLGDPYLDNMVGWRGYTPNLTPSAKTLQSKIDQLSGQGFVMAFQDLKGAGAITEQEGKAATAALSRLQSLIQSGEDYRAALKDFKAEVHRLRDVARAKAQGTSGPVAPGTTQGPMTPVPGTPQRLKFNPTTGALE